MQSFPRVLSTTFVITFGATDIDHIVDRRDVGQAIGHSQIGMLHNNVEANVRRPNMVKYRFRVDSGGEYNLRILYASNEPRPVQMELNDDPISQDALGISTGGWDNENRRWSTSYPVRLRSGDNSLLIRRSDVFPHLSKIELTQVRK